MDLCFVLEPLPLAHYISIAVIAIASKKYRIAIHDIIVISHRPTQLVQEMLIAAAYRKQYKGQGRMEWSIGKRAV